MKLAEKLLHIQTELKAPKNQRNTFGNYNYRSAEDILEALKLLLLKHKVTITIDDGMVNLQNRFYIKSTVVLRDTESSETISTNAFAREEETKKGMDGSQITGSTSSYARKNALNGMFAIDDTKDADGLNKHDKEEEKATATQVKFLKDIYKGENLTKLLQANKLAVIEDISAKKASELISKVSK